WEPYVIAGLDTLLTALCVELTDRIIPLPGPGRSGPGWPPGGTGAELACLAVAQVLLRSDDERHWLRAAPARIGHLFPRLLRQSECNDRVRSAALLTETALRWLAEQTTGPAEMLGLMDGTPGPWGQSGGTAKRSNLPGHAGYGHCASRSRFYRGARLMLIVTADGTVTGVLPGQSQAGRRAGPGPADAGRPASQPPAARHRRRHRQGPVRTGHRRLPRRAGPGPDPPGPQRREEAALLPELAAAACRGDHLDAEEPARSRAPWRPGTRRAAGPRGPAPARAQRRDLAQLADRRTGQAIPDRLRSLTCPYRSLTLPIFTGQRSSEAPPLTAELHGSLRDPFSGQAHAGTCGHDRPTAASPPRLVRPVLASVVPPQSGWSGLCLQRVKRALSTLRPPENSGQVSKS